MPNVYPKKGTRFWWCWGFDAEGKRWDESTKQTDKAAAKSAARDIERRFAVDSGWKTKSRLTLKLALKLVLDYQRKANRADATVQATQYHARHLIEILGGETPLPRITLGDTTAYLEKRLKQGAHRHTISKELKTLAQAMRRAEKGGHYRPEHSAVHFIPDELGTVYTPRDRWLTRAEYNALLVALAPTPKDKPMARPNKPRKTARRRAERQDRRDYVVAYCHLGVRKSELFDIQPGDYNAERRELRVRGTKTEGADRQVPVNDDAAEVLARRCDPASYDRAQLDRLRELGTKKADETLTDDEAVEWRLTNKPFPDWTDGNCTRDLAAACARAKIVKVTPNDMRRTFCSWLCQAGVPERVCAELMGHQSTVMVRSVYGHLDQRGMASAVSLLSSAHESLSATAPATALDSRASDAAKQDMGST